MEKKIKIGDKDVVFKATGATPLKYRNAFPGRDIFKDLISMESAEDGNLDNIDMGIFERIAYAMSDAYGKHIEFEEWLDGFEMMDIMNALPEIMEVWQGNMDTQSETVKNV